MPPIDLHLLLEFHLRERKRALARLEAMAQATPESGPHCAALIGEAKTTLGLLRYLRGYLAPTLAAADPAPSAPIPPREMNP